MLNLKTMIAGGAAALMLAGASAASAQATNLTYQQHVSCAAMFFVFSKMQSDPEDVSALEAATGVMLNRAIALPAARNLTEDQVIEAAVMESLDLEDRVNAASSASAKNDVVYRWGPGLDVCLTAVLEDM